MHKDLAARMEYVDRERSRLLALQEIMERLGFLYDAKHGTVIRFSKALTRPEAKSYLYAVILAPDGLWYYTGGRRDKDTTDQLLTFLSTGVLSVQVLKVKASVDLT